MTAIAVRTVTVDVPVTLNITIDLPEGDEIAVRGFAEKAAEHFAHVPETHIHAFNEVARVHDGIKAAVVSVATKVG